MWIIILHHMFEYYFHNIDHSNKYFTTLTASPLSLFIEGLLIKWKANDSQPNTSSRIWVIWKGIVFQNELQTECEVEVEWWLCLSVTRNQGITPLSSLLPRTPDSTPLSLNIITSSVSSFIYHLDIIQLRIDVFRVTIHYILVLIELLI